MGLGELSDGLWPLCEKPSPKGSQGKRVAGCFQSHQHWMMWTLAIEEGGVPPYLAQCPLPVPTEQSLKEALVTNAGESFQKVCLKGTIIAGTLGILLGV